MAFVKERGTIAVMSEVQSGTSQSGNTWSRQTIVVDVVG
jgi:4-aminobutyrate aminotransferase-like enzyme